MSYQRPVCPDTFEAIQNVDTDQLLTISEQDLRPILPCLVRMSLCAPLDSSTKWTKARKKILKCLSGIEVVNSLVGLLSIDFHALEQDTKKELQLRSKVSGSNPSESVLISSLEIGIALEFERSDAPRKLRLLLMELLFVMSQIKEPRSDFYLKSSELFECEVYLEEVSDVLCIAQAELPSLLPTSDVAEALLHVSNGTWLLCRLVANVPDSYEEVVSSLVSNGERQDEDSEGGQRRVEALKALCDMNPSYALSVRALCVELCKLPSLAIHITLKQNNGLDNEDFSEDDEAMETDQSEGRVSDMVAFISGLLLGSDLNVRQWIAQYIRAGQKRKDAQSGFSTLRESLMAQLKSILPVAGQLPAHHVVQGCALIKLYCAMKGIAAMRWNEDETKLLLQLITSRPPYTASGIRFVSLSLCMLLTGPYVLSTIDQERHTVDWLKWLMRDATLFERGTGESATFGEMLLLIAIHFHSNQTTAIADLVSSTLGMKSAVKANSLARIKTIFTQEIFTDQVVTSHAVRVAVTKNLNSGIPGYLPVHCVYQLLKSRAFSKHKVPIKDWILAQICECTTPIHPLVPSVIEVFVNSIIIPGQKNDRTNEPITEEEILAIFKDSTIARHIKSKRARSMRLSMTESLDMDQPCADKEKLTAQLLLVYYVLLYQDTCLNHMKSIVQHKRSVFQYSPQLMAQLPMKYLLQQAQKEQQLYAGLFSPLLRLLCTHYPHLCLVEDWVDEETIDHHPAESLLTISQFPCNTQNLQTAYDKIHESPSFALLLLEQLASVETSKILPYADLVIQNLHYLLDPAVPRKLIELTKKIWFKLNIVMPRKLRVMTVNALRASSPVPQPTDSAYTEDDITLDPMLVLRCDPRVFRCPPLVEVMLRILDAFLLASRVYLLNHIQTHPEDGKSSKKEPVLNQQAGSSDAEREELKNALIAAQESAAVQILLEICLPRSPDEQDESSSLLSNQREVQCLICSQLHRMYIAEPNLAKLVHFQGYPSELLAVTVPGIPSMHICLDFIPELISQPHIDKMIFAIQLVSHLSLQYALPKSMSVAKLAVNTMATMLTVLSSDKRADFFLPTLPAVVRISRAFPALADEVVAFLMQLARVCNSHMASVGNTMVTDLTEACEGDHLSKKKIASKAISKTAAVSLDLDNVTLHSHLVHEIQQTFSLVVKSTRLLHHRYPQI